MFFRRDDMLIFSFIDNTYEYKDFSIAKGAVRVQLKMKNSSFVRPVEKIFI
jgi:hypothetical protein